MLKSLIILLVSPINQILILIMLGFLLMRFTTRAKKLGKRLITLGALWFFISSQHLFSEILISPLENQFPPIRAENKAWQHNDVIWVLGCYHYETHSLPDISQFSNCSMERLIHALHMYRIKPTPIYLTGGHFVRNGKIAHANKAANLLIELGVLPEHIHAVPIGTNTIEEADAVLSQLQNKNIAVVSSASHGLRLAKILNKRNVQFTFVPVHFTSHNNNEITINFPSASALLGVERAIYEYAALAKLWFAE